ncbi:MAG: hypothetical protein H6965_06640 [Chromatiaceae bacterium]|nr:hypothetical protein [Chromatiaceae bacterium]
MDQDAYHKVYRELNQLGCLFEKGILSGQCNCSRAAKFYLAEREGVHCSSSQGQHRCAELLDLLIAHARFAIKSATQSSVLPHAKVMRIQIGGLKGLYLLLHQVDRPPAVVDDIYLLVEQAANRFNGLDRLPFSEIIRQVAAYQGRIRRSRR